MDEFRSYLPDAVIFANLPETAHRLTLVTEQERAHIAELAAEILSEGRQPSDLLASLPDRRLPNFDENTEILPGNSASVSKMQRLHALWQQILLCEELRSGLGFSKRELPDFFFPEAETVPENQRGRVIYQRSAYADTAYRHFSDRIDGAYALYTHNLTAVCEEVVRGNCEYCILPLGNSAEGMMPGVAKLIDQYALRTVASCDVPTEDGKKSTRFVLLRRNLLPLVSPMQDDTALELVIPFSDSPSVAELLLAAECYGLRPLHLDSGFRNLDGTSVFSIHFVFTVAQGDLCSYLLYLAMQAPDFEIRGIFRQCAL